eukprot:13352527-Alexandrium_andersonii.AAC.1
MSGTSRWGSWRWRPRQGPAPSGPSGPWRLLCRTAKGSPSEALLSRSREPRRLLWQAAGGIARATRSIPAVVSQLWPSAAARRRRWIS